MHLQLSVPVSRSSHTSGHGKCSILQARREGPAFFDEDNACAGIDPRRSLQFLSDRLIKEIFNPVLLVIY
jgi:hypothetical protein